jgi:hypothetical protein
LREKTGDISMTIADGELLQASDLLDIQATADAAVDTANHAQVIAEAALPSAGGVMTGTLQLPTSPFGAPALRLGASATGIYGNASTVGIGVAGEANPLVYWSAADGAVFSTQVTFLNPVFVGAREALGNESFRVSGGANIDNLALGAVGLFGAPPVITPPSVSGSRGDNEALASALTALARYGLIIDETTA